MEKTGITVTAYKYNNKTGEMVKGFYDISELHDGMVVREIGHLLQVVGDTIDDGEDYMIHTEKGYYSPLLIDSDEPTVKVSPEKEHKIDFITVFNGEATEYSMTRSELINTYNEGGTLPFGNDGVLSCVYAGTVLHFKTFQDLFYTFVGI